MDYVFGYGSLAWDPRRPIHQAELRGTRRVWGVAMDNTRDIPGYKHYRCRRDGSRPEVCVAFLDLEPAPGEAVNGICLAVTPERLAELDERERNYVRVDVTDHRIKLTVHNLDELLSGELADMTDALQDAEKRQRLEDAAA